MKAFLFAVLALCVSPVKADLITFPAHDLTSGALIMSDVNGTGIDLQFSLAGSVVSEGSITAVGSPMGGDAMRIGAEFDGQTSFIATNDLEFHVDVLNGFATFGIGANKQFGATGDTINLFKDDGFYSFSGGTLTDFSLSSTWDDFVENGSLAFNELDVPDTIGFPELMGNEVSAFVPWIENTTGFSMTRQGFGGFGSTDEISFGLELVSATPTAVSEPSSILFGCVCLGGLVYWRCRHGKNKASV